MVGSLAIKGTATEVDEVDELELLILCHGYMYTLIENPYTMIKGSVIWIKVGSKDQTYGSRLVFASLAPHSWVETRPTYSLASGHCLTIKFILLF